MIGEPNQFDDAIALARKLSLSEEKEALLQRLAHIRAVFRGRFSQ